jgi:hypothetical protein
VRVHRRRLTDLPMTRRAQGEDANVGSLGGRLDDLPGTHPVDGLALSINAVLAGEEQRLVLFEVLFTRPQEQVTWQAGVRCRELRLFPAGPEPSVRLVVATTDPAVLPPLTTWVLAAHLPRPGSRHAREAAVPPADLAEIVRLYGLRAWVEQGYKQLKHELGWADYQVRSGRAIGRHWTLVCCAFSFCWRAWFAAPPPPAEAAGPSRSTAPPTGAAAPPPPPAGGRGEKAARAAGGAGPRLARRVAARPGLARSLEWPQALLARLVDGAPASGHPRPARRARRRLRARPLRPDLTNYR